MAELAAKGAEFDGDVESRDFGRTISMRVPGAGSMVVCEPRHPTALDL